MKKYNKKEVNYYDIKLYNKNHINILKQFRIQKNMYDKYKTKLNRNIWENKKWLQ